MRITEKDDTVLLLSPAHLAGLMRAVLEKGAKFRFTANGESMAPFIRNGDIIVVSPVPERGVRNGDVVVFRNAADGVMVHRIVRRRGGKVLLKGDNNPRRDGIFSEGNIIGVVTTVERGGRKIWHGGQGVAWLSASGLLNRLILPALRFVKRQMRGFSLCQFF
ncbi:MAG: signal peptidase I [Lentisphaeria bacterium]|nr:signal peptidase I [Lentisphaeria bacterium]